MDTGYKETFFALENVLQNFKLTPKDIAHIILTQGHSMILFQKGEQKILFIADLVNLSELQCLEPGIFVSYDIDKLQAAQTRRDMLELYKDTRLIGAHFPFLAPLNLTILENIAQ
ncbi:hypothetical protein [Helicobacter himalayensis]|uniref:hypothetical protein n=1 Tax=Helicobacter himalayensis TaxID=1591088 RepID=UPI0008371249|nr:hypothetical protein [Helicobacter himalayensis]